MASQARQKLLDTALALFSRHGFHATGIDRLTAESGVSKKTLYNHFKSKDELILAALRRWDEERRLWFMRSMEQRARAPEARLLALFDVLDEWFGHPDFYGCPFINATAEYSDSEDPIHAVASEHKRLFRAYLGKLANDAGFARPDDVVAQIALLMDGAIVTAQFTNNVHAGQQARQAADVILAQAERLPTPEGSN